MIKLEIETEEVHFFGTFDGAVGRLSRQRTLETKEEKLPRGSNSRK
jgi:hypothetical protein